ncbi:MAG: CRISPR-associated protein Cas4 [Bacteroidia bacterium]|nr:MAG: CRISPR-associated protein Cas4 [Bacteroidia bacterium]
MLENPGRETAGMFTEDNFIQLSALQHYVFCPRQCALIHVDDVWRDNVLTVRGNILHEKVDTDTYETRGAVKTVRALKIHSSRLGLAGKCDVVEFHKAGEGIEILPVEFKAGQPKHDSSDEVQLCAQALCLEEMLNARIRRGAFFYGRIRRRVQVEIGDQLRKRTEEVIAAVHDLVSRKEVPQAQYQKKCARCSLADICQPKAMNKPKLASYMVSLYRT